MTFVDVNISFNYTEAAFTSLVSHVCGKTNYIYIMYYNIILYLDSCLII